ncbi:MAG TPA: hypothetical protein VLF21_01910 [Candidatus Saccharimonadales bacterium]|nr:hypothetical protein [Candidatus Saccharimonadales bacterium]
MEIPTSGWPKKAYDAMLAKDKDEFDYAMTRYCIYRGEAEANQLVFDLYDLMPDDIKLWWLEEDASLPPVEETGERNFQRAIIEMNAERRRN